MERAPWKEHLVAMYMYVNGHQLWEGRTQGNWRGKSASGSLAKSPRKPSAPSWAVPCLAPGPQLSQRIQGLHSLLKLPAWQGPGLHQATDVTRFLFKWNHSRWPVVCLVFIVIVTGSGSRQFLNKDGFSTCRGSWHQLWLFLSSG